MYRVFCESLDNYINSFVIKKDYFRLQIAYPLQLLADESKYKIALVYESVYYKQVSDLLTYMKNNTHRYPKSKAFLWTLESRGMKAKVYGISSSTIMEEQTKLINMFLNLQYWEKLYQII